MYTHTDLYIYIEAYIYIIIYIYVYILYKENKENEDYGLMYIIHVVE